MNVTSPQQYDDPLGEARGQMLQAFAVFTTVGEAAARFAVAGAHNRAAKAEQKAKAAQVAAAGHVHADQADASARAARDKTARRLMDKLFDDDWLAKANLADTAELWRTAAMYASAGDRRAAQAVRRAEDRLSQLNPLLMDAYTRHRAAGMNLAEAMRAAAHDVWQQEAHATASNGARPHGNSGDSSPALRANGPAIGAIPDPHGLRMVDELEAATRAEVARLAADVDPELLDRLQRQWRSAGHAPAADAAALLANAARQLRAESQLGDPATGTATVRRGPNHSTDPANPAVGHDSVDVPVRTSLAGYELAAQGLDRAADTVRAAQAAERHLGGLADQQDRAGSLDQGVTDMPATRVDEHRDAMASGRLRHGGAEHDHAAAGQQQRLGRAFPPLGTVNPIFTAGSAPTNPSTTQRKGKTR
jgi:hypothetical protein